jgi:hypothetical protein
MEILKEKKKTFNIFLYRHKTEHAMEIRLEEFVFCSFSQLLLHKKKYINIFQLLLHLIMEF